MTWQIQKPTIGHYSVMFRHIQNLVQHLHTQQSAIFRILEYSEPLHKLHLNAYSEPSY